MERLAALIVAAGFSTRMDGLFKPLLTLQFPWPSMRERSALQSVAELYALCGATDIIIVIGQRESTPLTHAVAQMQKEMSQSIHLVSNPDATRGMFSSVCEGLRAIPANCSHCFIHPVDIPLVRPCTLHHMLRAKNAYSKAVLLPTYKGKTGHPPLLPTGFIPRILEHHHAAGKNDLRGALQDLPQRTIPTPDSHILLDMDTQKDYARLQKKSLQYHILRPTEARELLYCLHVPPQGFAHAEAVARLATAFAKAYVLQDKYSLCIPLTKTGALLHDMCKQEKQHEIAAGNTLRALGLDALAPLVEQHNDCQLTSSAPVTEKELIYLADKYVFGSQPVPIQQRFAQKLHLYSHIPEACVAIQARLTRALAMEKRVLRDTSIHPFHMAKKVLTP